MNTGLRPWCISDDILIFSENKDDVVKMLGEFIDAFAQEGLDISVDKCAWSSDPPVKQAILNVVDFGLRWVKSLTFVGTVINFSDPQQARTNC